MSDMVTPPSHVCAMREGERAMTTFFSPVQQLCGYRMCVHERACVCVCVCVCVSERL